MMQPLLGSTARSTACPSYGSSGRVLRWMFKLHCVMGLLVASSAQAAPPEGVDREVDDAIVSALRFIASQQQPAGGWNVDSFGGEATSAASLSVMAFLAAGHMPEIGRAHV